MDEFEKEFRDKCIKDYYDKAIEFVKGSKIYGFTTDIDNPKEVIVALWILYQNKEVMYQLAKESQYI